ncbi:extracellular solute-binding protein [Streptomyces sp. M41]|uniref:extracellular solute-binding protein n=1 Tax=Streptomyces sp. M41 TaxID=3059412 RepID=UPI00374CECD2
MTRLTAPLVRCALVLGLLLAAVGCGKAAKDQVTIMVPWTETEFQAFYAVINDFEDRYPAIDVVPQVTRDLTPQLDAAVAAKAAPDLAVLASVGAITKFRNDKVLEDLEVGTAAFIRPFRDLAMHRGDVYAVPVKADVKSLVWYDPKVVVPAPPSTWPALVADPEPWCLGLASGPTSGWPGADWIADILLAEEGITTYKDWASGAREWSSDPVARAWSMWHDVIEESDRSQASTLKFSKASKGMADSTCSLSHGALSAMDFAPGKEEKYTYARPREGQPLEVSADFVGQFTTSEHATTLIKYLATAKAQQIWVDQPGFALSPHKKVIYPDPDSAEARTAQLLRSGHPLCFSAADAMDPDVSAAFYRAVLEYVKGGELRPLLESLDRVQERLGNDDSPPSAPLCGPPNRP